jgi:hypothetical protein
MVQGEVQEKMDQGFRSAVLLMRAGTIFNLRFAPFVGEVPLHGNLIREVF